MASASNNGNNDDPNNPSSAFDKYYEQFGDGSKNPYPSLDSYNDEFGDDPTPSQTQYKNEIGDRDNNPYPSHDSYENSFNRNELDPGDLGEAEENGGEEAPINSSDEEKSIESLQDQDDGTYFYDEQRGQYGKRSALQFSFGKKRRRNLLLISLASGLFVGTMGLSILSGPFQLIQIANLLRGFHFSDQENVTNNRIGKIAKYIRYADTPEKTRLSFVQNKLADRMELKMNDSGIKSRYNPDIRGALAGYDIDVTKFDDPELKRLMDPSTVRGGLGGDLEGRYGQIVDHVKATYNLDISPADLDFANKTVRTNANTGYSSNRKILKNFLKKSGLSTLGSIRTRIGLKKAGVTLHPIRKIDNAINQKGAAFIKKHISDKRKQRIKNGADSVKNKPITATPDDPNGTGTSTVDPGADNAVKTAADVAAPVPDAPDVAAKKSTIKSKMFKAAGITAVAGVVCLVKGLADNVDEVNQARIVLPLARYSGEIMATGNQLMAAGVEASSSIAAGQKPSLDVDMLQIEAATEVLKSNEFGNWYHSTEVQAALGKDSPGREIAAEARIDPEGNAVGQFLNGIPLLGGLCDVIDSTFGYVALTALGVATGAASAVVGEVFMRTIAPSIIDGVVSTIAEEEVDLGKIGPMVGSYSMHGGRHAANASMLPSGGTALSPEQVVAWDDARNEELLEQYQEGGFFAQFLNPLDARTSVGNVVAQSSSSPTENMALIFKTSMKGIASMLNPANLFGGKAKAASIPHDYGFDIYSFGIDTLEDPRYEIPQENSKLAVELLNGSSGDRFIERAKSCFGVRIDKDGGVLSEGQSPSYSSIKKSDASCTDKAEDWTRIRFHILDNQTASAALCLENIDCSDFGFDEGVSSGGSSTGPTNQDLPDYVDSSPCPTDPDIKPAGTGVAIRNGVDVYFTTCTVLDTARVNVVYANNFLGLFKGARAAGHDLTGSGGSFLDKEGALNRWKERCDTRPISAGYAQPPCTGAPIAPPGFSNHEIGLAVDLNCGGGLLGGGTTLRSQFDTNDPCVAWVRSNSKQFGLILQCDRVRSDGTQSEKCESWHISPTGG